jgi:hypothetical protein
MLSYLTRYVRIEFLKSQQDGAMTMVTVYRFTKYDIASDNICKSRRYGTREAIERLCGTILEDTAAEVDASVLGAEIDGLTSVGFDPYASSGFQREVRSELRKPQER